MILPATRRIVEKPSSIAGHLRPVGCRPGCKSKEEVERLNRFRKRCKCAAELFFLAISFTKIRVDVSGLVVVFAQRGLIDGRCAREVSFRVIAHVG